MQRLNYIDQLKGFAILCVVFGHVMLFCLKCSHNSFVYHVVCSFHMPLFAFLSGLMFKPVEGWRTALGKFRAQSLKLLVPFAAVGLVYTYWTLNRGGEDFVHNGAKMGYWYLFFLWQCYLITHLYNIVCAGKLKSLGKRRFAVDAIFVLVMIAGIKAVWKLSLMDNDTWGLYWLFGLYPLFFAGHVIQREGVIGKMFEWRGRWFDIAVIAYVGISLLAVVCFEARKGKGLVLQAAEPFAVYAIVCLFVKTRGYADKWKTWLESCGRHSLDIYVLHYFLIQSCHMDFVAGPGSPFAGNYFVLTLLALFITAIIALVCMAMSWLIRQSRLFAFLFLGIRENGNIEKFKN